jgi:hypothetical protein
MAKNKLKKPCRKGAKNERLMLTFRKISHPYVPKAPFIACLGSIDAFGQFMSKY